MDPLIHRFFTLDVNQVFMQRLLFHAYMITRCNHDGSELLKRVSTKGHKSLFQDPIGFLRFSGVLDENNHLVVEPSGNSPFYWVEEELDELIGIEENGSKSIEHIILHSGASDGDPEVSLDNFYKWSFRPGAHHKHTDPDEDKASVRRLITDDLMYWLNGGSHQGLIHKEFSRFTADLRTMLVIMSLPNQWELFFSSVASYRTDAFEARESTITEAFAKAQGRPVVIYAPAFKTEAIELAEQLGVALLNMLAFLRLHRLMVEVANDSKSLKQLRSNFPQIFQQAGLVDIQAGWAQAMS